MAGIRTTRISIASAATTRLGNHLADAVADLSDVWFMRCRRAGRENNRSPMEHPKAELGVEHLPGLRMRSEAEMIATCHGEVPSRARAWLTASGSSKLSGRACGSVAQLALVVRAPRDDGAVFDTTAQYSQSSATTYLKRC